MPIARSNEPEFDIPLHRPLLPTRDRLTPYLDRIDATRRYTNNGFLVRELEGRVAERLGRPPMTVVAVANATLGLTLAAADEASHASGRCLVPAWTFAACGHAAIAAGLEPHFVDVTQSTWSMDAGEAAAACAEDGPPVVVAMPVMPFGCPSADGWKDLAVNAGVPLVIDAAAGFDWVIRHRPRFTTVVSLHATKILPAGEGALVIARTREQARRIRSAANFGLNDRFIAAVPALNAKMSEYEAAVALASLDEWPAIREDWLRVAGFYLEHFTSVPGLAGVRSQPGFGTEWIAANLVVRVPAGKGRKIAAELCRQGIQSRPWWSRGLPGHPAFSGFSSTSTDVTGVLENETLALPFFRDMTEDQVGKVCTALASALR